jgi:hypothetical protein
MTITDTMPAAAPGDATEYGTAAALATAAERLADAVDDNRPDWFGHAVAIGDLLASLVAARLAGIGYSGGFDAVLDAIFASAARRPAIPEDQPAALFDAEPYRVAADLSATAGDIASDIAEGRSCPGTVTHARRLMNVLATALGEPEGENR